MKRLLTFLTLMALGATLAVAQTAATQQSTSSTAATDNAQKSPAPPTQPQPASTSDAKSAQPKDAPKTDAPVAVEPSTIPTVKTFPENKVEAVDPRIASQPLPKKKLSLIGGTVKEIDPIRNRMTVDIYGGKQMKLIFDDRTKVTRNGADVNPLIIRKGDRVYLDTQLASGNKIFAKQIQIVTKFEAADLNGQIVNFDPKTRTIELRDQLSAAPFRFTVDQDAAITANGGKAATQADLQPGALVMAHFNNGQGGRGTIRDINIIAAPGAEFTLYGRVNHLDLRSGVLAVQNKADDKAYEVKFSPAQFKVDDLAIGSEVAVTAKFNGQDYVAQSLNVTSTGQAAKVDSDEGAEAKDADKSDKKDKDKDSKKAEKKKDKDKDKDSEEEPK
ncbi:MAG TPA: hypothetical protein VNR20_00070 [Terriglobales bacterium]|nr:hypothetical protein [Terriglobales bacterium]